MDNYDRAIIKRIATALLCALIFVSFMPDMTYALEEQQEPTEISADTVESESVDSEPEIPEPLVIDSEPEAADPLVTDSESEAVDSLSTDPETEAESPVSTESEPELEDLINTDLEEVVLTEEMADDDTLLEGYMDSRLNEELGRPKPGSGMRKAAVSKRRNQLSKNEIKIYDTLKDFIYKAASGKVSTAVISRDITDILEENWPEKDGYYVITGESLGISSGVYVKDDDGEWILSDGTKARFNNNFKAIIDALLADEPYAFYWYDKTETGGAYVRIIVNGIMVNKTGDAYIPKTAKPMIEVMFTVSENYRAKGGGYYDLDTVKTAAASQAATKAASIINAYDSASDYEKLIAYKETICELTSYNDAAAYNSVYPYGDPWQMIYVFDENPSTKVVCEGYSKAFQYLCDNTYFVNEIECDSVTGTMYSRNVSGNHMWNILHMDDGRNYIADLTNSDTDSIGCEGGIFISPAMAGGSVAEGYQYDVYINGRTDGDADLKYTYDKDTRALFSEDELTMSEDEYEIPPFITNISYEWAEDGSRCKARGTWSDTGKTVEENAVISAAVIVPASCFREGITAYTAKFKNRHFRTQKKNITDIAAYGVHAWDGGTVTVNATESAQGQITYTCMRCGERRTGAIPAIVYPTDLPNVKISKPKAGKKKMTVKWKKVSKKNQKKISGIEIQVATDPGFTNIVKTANGSKKKTSKVIKGLKSKKRYYVRIRAYKYAADGKHISYWKSKSSKVK